MKRALLPKLVLSAAVSLAAIRVVAAPPTAAALTVSMLPAGAGAYRVTVLFPRIIPRKKAADALNDLSARAHWTPSHIVWSATPAAPRFPSQTAVDFVVPSAFPNGRFPLDPFILAFKPWKTMNLLIAHGGAFQYSGPAHYQTPDVIVDAAPNPMSLTLRVNVLNTKVQAIDIPQALGRPAPAAPVSQGRHKRLPAFVWVILALVAAALAWVVVYALMLPRPKVAKTP